MHFVHSLHCVQQREQNLTESRLKESWLIVQRSLKQFAAQKSEYFIERKGCSTINVQRMDRVNHEMMHHFMSNDQLGKLRNSFLSIANDSLQKWTGIQKSDRLRRGDIRSYDAYFKTARNWFDQHKIELLSRLCWTPLFQSVEQLCRSAACVFFNDRFSELQRLYRLDLYLLILLNLMQSTVSLSNAGKKLLIPTRALVKMKPISKFLQVQCTCHEY